jgi:hypothetical protein
MNFSSLYRPFVLCFFVVVCFFVWFGGCLVWLFGLGWVVHRHLVSSHSLAIAACRDLICVIVGMSLVLPLGPRFLFHVYWDDEEYNTSWMSASMNVMNNLRPTPTHLLRLCYLSSLYLL